MLHAPGRSAGGVPVLATTVKILDTSLTRSYFEQSFGDASPRLTHEGQLLGTPEYLAPEQSRDARQTDIRADLYSLGCILYHAAAGRPPFQDPSPVGVVLRHVTELPRPLREFRSDLPPTLEQTIERLLAKDPADRFADPAAAATALQAAAADSVHPMDTSPSRPATLDIPFPAFGDEQPKPVPIPGPDLASSRYPDTKGTSPIFNTGLPLLLGALGLLAAQGLGWLLAYLVHAFHS
jgi:serine/threonine-protein kinase